MRNSTTVVGNYSHIRKLMESISEMIKIVNDLINNRKNGSTETSQEKPTRDRRSTPGEFIALFKRKNLATVIWKLKCSKTKDEYVAEIVPVEESGRYLVDHAFLF